MGVPVVSTAIGAEGLPLHGGDQILIADTPEAQTDAIVELLSNRGLADRLATSALRFVREHCSWDAVSEQFLSKCLSVQRPSSLEYNGACA